MPPIFRNLHHLVLCAILLGCGGPPQNSSGDGSRESDPESPAAESSLPDPGFAQNVLLITIDTLRADALGYTGNSKSQTPVLDRLAAEGHVFERTHAHNVMTLPSHASILTGLLPFQHGVRDNGGFVLASQIPTLATLLKSAGFATAAFVGAFPLDARYGLHRGFDLYDDRYPEGTQTSYSMPERRGDDVVAQALEWWKTHSDSRRLLWIHLYDPHAPYAPEEPWASRFADDLYLGEVAAVDAYLGTLLEPILETDDSTLVVFTADHGEALGDHGETTHGLFAYEATLKVPLILWADALEPARRDTPASHVDILPTLLEATGVEAAEDLPGHSLLSHREGASPIYFEALNANLQRGWAPLRGVIQNDYKLISLPLPELYDLESDPEESENLFATESERARELAALIPQESEWPPARQTIGAAEERALRGLGYLTTEGPGATTRGHAEYTEADDPKNLVEIDQKVHRFVDLHKAGRLAEATKLMREVVKEQPGMAIAQYYLAEILLDQRRLKEALEVMVEAHRLGAASESLTRQFGLTLTEVGRAPEGLRVLEPFESSSDPDNLNALGLVLAETGELDRAERLLERVFAVDRQNSEAHQNLALVALYRTDWSKCEMQARQALALNKELPLAWNYLGLALYNRGEHLDALEAWKTSVALEPRDYDLLYNLAMVAAEVGQGELAREALGRFINNAPPQQYGQDILRAKTRLQELDG